VQLAKNHHEIRVRATCPRTGRRKEVRREETCTLTEARALQQKWREEVEQSLTVVAAPRVRLRDFAASWLRGRIEAGRLKPSSATKIAVVFDLHIATAAIADLHIDAITPSDIEQWLEGLRRKRYAPGKGAAAKRKGAKVRGYSSTTIRGYYRVLRTMITAATAKARLPNPCDGVESPTATSRDDNFLTGDELPEVLAFVERSSPAWYPAVLLDVLPGLRWGELSALRWDDIAEAPGVIRVARGNSKGEPIGSPKTGKAKVVPLLPAVADALRAHRLRMMAAQHPGLHAGWIFPTEAGTLHKGSPLRRVLDAACAAASVGRRVTPHGLRHTANDLLRRVASAEVTRAIVGHATAQMTHHYSHVDEGEKRAAAARVLDLAWGGKGVPDGVATDASPSELLAPETENPALSQG
jgi:integrase